MNTRIQVKKGVDADVWYSGLTDLFFIATDDLDWWKVRDTDGYLAFINKSDATVIGWDEGIDKTESITSDGSTAAYYELPSKAVELQDLISYKNMNAQIGEIFRACYRYGECSHSAELRDAKKIKFYIDAEIRRLEGV